MWKKEIRGWTERLVGRIWGISRVFLQRAQWKTMMERAMRRKKTAARWLVKVRVERWRGWVVAMVRLLGKRHVEVAAVAAVAAVAVAVAAAAVAGIALAVPTG